jgi:ribosome-binding factor A
VSGDLQHAKIYVSIMGSDKEQTLTLRGLKHAAGFIQAKLAKRLQTRFTPVVQFVLDQGVKKSIEMTRLINEALATGLVEPAVVDATSETEDSSSQPTSSTEGSVEPSPEP